MNILKQKFILLKTFQKTRKFNAKVKIKFNNKNNLLKLISENLDLLKHPLIKVTDLNNNQDKFLDVNRLKFYFDEQNKFAFITLEVQSAYVDAIEIFDGLIKFIEKLDLSEDVLINNFDLILFAYNSKSKITYKKEFCFHDAKNTKLILNKFKSELTSSYL